MNKQWLQFERVHNVIQNIIGTEEVKNEIKSIINEKRIIEIETFLLQEWWAGISGVGKAMDQNYLPILVSLIIFSIGQVPSQPKLSGD